MWRKKIGKKVVGKEISCQKLEERKVQGKIQSRKWGKYNVKKWVKQLSNDGYKNE